MVGVVSRGRVTDIARAIAWLSRVDAREHTAIVELLSLGEPQLLLQIANPLLAILVLTSLIIGEARKCLRHEDVNLLVERIQELYSGGERRFAFHKQFLWEEALSKSHLNPNGMASQYGESGSWK